MPRRRRRCAPRVDRSDDHDQRRQHEQRQQTTGERHHEASRIGQIRAHRRRHGARGLPRQRPGPGRGSHHHRRGDRACRGPIAPYDEGPYKAMEVAVDEINAKGGVLGRPLKIVYADTKSDISYGATAAQQVIDQGAVMVVVTCDYDYGSAAANVANSQEPDRLLHLRRRSEIRPRRHRPQRLHHGDRLARPGGADGRVRLQAGLEEGLYPAGYLDRLRGLLRRHLPEALDPARRGRQFPGQGHLRRRRSADRDPDHPHQGPAQPARFHRHVLLPAGRLQRHAPDPRRRA